MKNNNPARWLGAIAMTVCVAAGASSHGRDNSNKENSGTPTSVAVSGAISERAIAYNVTGPHGVIMTAMDTVSGDLAGTGILHIYSSEIDGENSTNVISTRVLHTSQGHLFLSEVGENVAGAATVRSTVTGGTGIYKGSTGQLVLEGVHDTPATIAFTYTGTLTVLK